MMNAEKPLSKFGAGIKDINTVVPAMPLFSSGEYVRRVEIMHDYPETMQMQLARNVSQQNHAQDVAKRNITLPK